MRYELTLNDSTQLAKSNTKSNILYKCMDSEYHFNKSNKQDASELDYITINFTEVFFNNLNRLFLIHITQLTGYDMTWIIKIHAMNDMQYNSRNDHY